MNINTDMPENGWWDNLPKKYHKWIRLGRFDRPIGSWLLLLPCLWTLPIFLNSIIDLLEIYFIFIIRISGIIIFIFKTLKNIHATINFS